MYPTVTFNLDKIYPFGCDAEVLIDETQRGKLQPKTEPGIFVGHHYEQNAHKIMLLNTLEVVVSRDFTVKQHSFENLKQVKSRISKQAVSEFSAGYADNHEYEVESIVSERDGEEEKEFLVYWKGWMDPTWEVESNLTNCRELLDKYYRLHASAYAAIETQSTDVSSYVLPTTYQEALQHPDREKWIAAIQSELDSLKLNQVFAPAVLPAGKKALPTRWVFVVKRDENNQIIKHKARLVVKGFKQIEGIDYNETFAPTVKMKSIKLLLALTASERFIY